MRPILPLILIAVLAAAPGAQARPPLVTDAPVPRELPGDGPVQVRWTDPAEFTELAIAATAGRPRVATGS